MNEIQATDFTTSLAGILAVVMGVLLAAPANAAEPAREAAVKPAIGLEHIYILRPDRLLLQITGQPRGEAPRDSRRMPVAYISGQDRGYRNVSRSNLLNSPAARYLAKALTGSGKY